MERTDLRFLPLRELPVFLPAERALEAEMESHLDLQGTFGNFLGELPEQAGLTEDIFRAGPPLQQLIYEAV